MAFRGYFALNGIEIANSSRVSAHLGAEVPTTDFGYFGNDPEGYSLVEDPPGSGLYIPGPPMGAENPPGSGLYDVGGLLETGPGLYATHVSACALTEVSPGLWETNDSSTEVSPGLWTPPEGALQYGPGLFVMGECWGSPTLCSSCKTRIDYDDSWPGLREFLNDVPYRPEVAPWFTVEQPESSEFGGVWVMDIKGLDATPVERPITEAVGHGGIAGPHRDKSRALTFEALLIACTNAGVEYGLKWLTTQLRTTKDNVSTPLRYLTSSPTASGVDPASLVREAHGTVLTKEPEVTERINTYSAPNRHANMYRITWEMVVLSPYAYYPSIPVDVDWDQVTRQPINWIHAADCEKPETCVDMPVMFSEECVPESVERIATPPPVCGGCMPVSAIDKYRFRVPTMDFAFTSRETVVSLVLKNTGERALTLQAFFRICNSDVRCEDNQFPLQVSGLPAGAELHLDGINATYRVWFDERWRLPGGVVGTPTGAPWRPPLIDRRDCYDFIVQASSSAEFEVAMTLIDRES